MNTIGAAPTGFEQYSLAEKDDEPKSNELGQNEFLKLMLEQIKHQDPMEPTGNGEFIAQMAQFSTVEGIEKMQQSLDNLSSAYGSSQTLQASSLVGRDVMIENTTLVLEPADGDAPRASGGRFTLEASSGAVTLDVSDPGGALVRRIPLGAHGAGTHDFSWDGLDEDGQPLPPGNYVASVTTDGLDDEPMALPVLVARTVDSVEFAPGGKVTVNTKAGDSLTLGDVRQISDRQSD